VTFFSKIILRNDDLWLKDTHPAPRS
jgi:hypothetical protein